MNEFSILPAGATHMRCSFWTARNAAHPMWERWRSGTGYFVVEHDGRPCWVGVAADEMKSAFARWLHAGAPSSCDHTLDERDTVLFVNISKSDDFFESLLPGRRI